VVNPRAPRTKRRLSCEINVNDARYSGIVLDISATGLFVQTNVKPNPGVVATLRLSLPGHEEPVSVKARVARKKMVPRQLLTVAGGGVGFAITESCEAYLDFVAGMSPEHAEAAGRERTKLGKRSGSGTPGAKSSGAAGGGKAADGKEKVVGKRFRIHAVETRSGRKNSFLVTAATEQEAGDQVLEELGDEWKVLFIERA
jgi:hypothetical protein